jgi:uncharacterized glyoxalase superfamily protein PhnB
MAPAGLAADIVGSSEADSAGPIATGRRPIRRRLLAGPGPPDAVSAPPIHAGEPMRTKTPAPAGAPTRAEPQSLRARELAASLTVKDLQKSLAWYRDVAGFTVEREHERDGKLRSVSLKAGDVQILINQDDGARGWDRVKGEGFSLRFTTDQSVDDLAAQIKENGGTLETEPTDTPWGARLFRLRDPDGFKLVFSTPREG